MPTTQDYEKAIKILERKTTIPSDDYSWEEIENAINLAILELGKQIPKQLIKEKWCPNLCPTCKADLGGECDDGYYENPYYEYCPHCGKKIYGEDGLND